MIPELLAPAGDVLALRAALAAGADAVYLGLRRFSARAYAGNFDDHELPAAIDRAHLFGARVYLALNTLLKDDELGTALAALEAPYASGLDALIVADLGFAALVRRSFPDLRLHASTQLNTHSSAQLAGLARLGFCRAVLARELSLAEIEALETHGVELEVFVHGALCYGYSGDCLFSSMVGGRSGNRGRCSQACRMRYALRPAQDHGVAAPLGKAAGDAAASGRPLVAGSPRGRAAAASPCGIAGRVLSASDLAAVDALPRLIAAGVSALKIEGRMKDAAYVATVTAVYREALAAAAADPVGYRVLPEWRRRLEQSFSRGFTTAHLDGRHAEVRSHGRGGHRGVAVGRVEVVDEDRGLITVRLTQAAAPGDVLSIFTPWGKTEPERLGALLAGGSTASAGSPVGSSGTITGTTPPPTPETAPAPEARASFAAGSRVVLRLRERVSVKDRVFRLSSEEVDTLARDAIAGRVVARPVPLHAVLTGGIGAPARLELRADGLTASAQTAALLQPAETAALTPAKARDAIAALGGTPYALVQLDYQVGKGAFLPVGALKELRRRAVDELDERRLARLRRTSRVSRRPAGALRREQRRAPRVAGTAPARLAPGRSTAGISAPPLGRQVSAATFPVSFARGALPLVLRLAVDEAPLDVQGLRALCLDVTPRDTARRIARAMQDLGGSGLALRCRPPELLFDADAAWWRAVAALPWDAVYARHLAHLSPSHAASGTAAILEYPLQGLNATTAWLLRPHAVVASPEASLDEIAALTADLAACDPPIPVEVVAFGRQQLLTTRDRLGEAEGLVGLPAEPGRSRRRTPETASLHLDLADDRGFVFPVEVAPEGTRIFNSRVTNVAAALPQLAAAGVAAAVVVQRDLLPAERAAFAAGGLAALAPFAGRERSTTGHLFRGVA